MAILPHHNKNQNNGPSVSSDFIEDGIITPSSTEDLIPQQIPGKHHLPENPSDPFADNEAIKEMDARLQVVISHFKGTSIDSDDSDKASVLPTVHPKAPEKKASGHIYPTAKEIEERVRTQREIIAWKPPKHLMQRPLHENARKVASSVRSSFSAGFSKFATSSAEGAGALLYHARRRLASEPRDEQAPRASKMIDVETVETGEFPITTARNLKI
ncbi:hypothetical protein ACHAQH_000886 [Verticillium albo-atrum]